MLSALPEFDRMCTYFRLQTCATAAEATAIKQQLQEQRRESNSYKSNSYKSKNSRVNVSVVVSRLQLVISRCDVEAWWVWCKLTCVRLWGNPTGNFFDIAAASVPKKLFLPSMQRIALASQQECPYSHMSVLQENTIPDEVLVRGFWSLSSAFE